MTRILVTGGSGFLGSHLVEALRAKNLGEIVAPRAREFDLCDQAQTERLFDEVRPDLVYHLAARVGGIGANRRHPGTFFRDNMAMGLHVLEAARKAQTRKVVIAGTVCAYPKHTPVPFHEDDLWNGYPEETNAPYGIAKKALLVMAQAYRAEFGSNFVMVFPVNLYGPRDNFDLEDSHVIPAMIRKLDDARRNGAEEVILWGDGTPTREFLYVEDCVEGLCAAGERYDGAEPVNLGSGHEIAMHDLATTIGRAVGFTRRIEWDPKQPNGQPRRSLDVRRAKARFGFEAKTPLAEGLALTIAWWRDHRDDVLAAEAQKAKAKAGAVAVAGPPGDTPSVA
jgi:GDP-L-fucose synthase